METDPCCYGKIHLQRRQAPGNKGGKVAAKEAKKQRNWCRHEGGKSLKQQNAATASAAAAAALDTDDNAPEYKEMKTGSAATPSSVKARVKVKVK